MSKVLVVPDVHLKPWMFDDARALASKGKYDYIVLLGDIADDWNQQENLKLYDETFAAAVRLAREYLNTLWCYGNHDLSYLWQRQESGYSEYARETVVKGIRELRSALGTKNCKYIHRIDDVLFSHAGLTERFVSRQIGPISKIKSIDKLLDKINNMGMYEMWREDSPIWARPQCDNMQPYPYDAMQVVGHTPVAKPLYEEYPCREDETKFASVLTLDTFSTHSNGSPIGYQRFVCVDTRNHTWEYVK